MKIRISIYIVWDKKYLNILQGVCADAGYRKTFENFVQIR